MKNLDLFNESTAATVALPEADLVAKLKAAEAAYYNGSEIMEDAEYDILRDQLTELNPNHPHLANVGAPLSDVGMRGKSSHGIPMGSQKKAKNRAEFDKWLAVVSKAIGVSVQDLILHLSEKLDGCSFSLRFVAGRLVECLGRGEGDEGEDITSNALKFRGIPSFVAHPIAGEPFTGWIRAEVVLFTEEWKKVDPLMESNPRNIGGGIARRSSGVDSDKLQVMGFRAFDENAEVLGNTEEEVSANMEKMGFMVAPHLLGSPDVVWDYFTKWGNDRSELAYWIDGGVVKLNDISSQLEMGEASNRPKGQVALKFPANGTPSVLEDVIITVGHTGQITPTGAFKPVRIGGTTVSSALLVNWDTIAQMDIAIGDSVEIYKAGEIIPKVLRVTERPDSRKVITEPTCCPVCSSENIGKKKNLDGQETAHIFCLNTECSAKASGKIGRYVNSLKILGIGDEVLEAMVEDGLVENAADLYTLQGKFNEFSSLSMGTSGVRLGESRAQSIIDEIDKCRYLTLDQLLGSLGIDGLGKRRVEKIISAVPSHLNTLDAWFDGSLITHAKAASIPKLAKKIQDSMEANRPVIEKILSNNVTWKPIVVEVLSADAISFCMTGKLSQSKTVYEKLVKDAGHEWKKTVAAGLDYLVMADPESSSSKAVKARKLGVKCISEEALIEMLQA